MLLRCLNMGLKAFKMWKFPCFYSVNCLFPIVYAASTVEVLGFVARLHYIIIWYRVEG